MHAALEHDTGQDKGHALGSHVPQWPVTDSRAAPVPQHDLGLEQEFAVIGHAHLAHFLTQIVDKLPQKAARCLVCIPRFVSLQIMLKNIEQLYSHIVMVT